MKYIIMSIFIFSLFQIGSSATVTWTGGSSTDWHEEKNWSPIGVPKTGDDVVITGNVDCILGNDDGEVLNSIVITNGRTLAIDENGHLRLSGTSSHAVHAQNSAVVYNIGQITITNYTGNGCYFELSTNLNNEGSLQINTVSAKGIVNEGSIQNEGQLIILSSTDIGIENNGSFDNTDDITIDNLSNHGIHNLGIFNNDKRINISDLNSINSAGIQNDSTFQNNVGGKITISDIQAYGLNNLAQFISEGDFTISEGVVASIGILNQKTIELKGSNVISKVTRGIRNQDSLYFAAQSDTEIDDVHIGIDNNSFIQSEGKIMISNSVSSSFFNSTFINNDTLLIVHSSLRGFHNGKILKNNGAIIISNTLFDAFYNTDSVYNSGLIEVDSSQSYALNNQNDNSGNSAYFENKTSGVIQLRNSTNGIGCGGSTLWNTFSEFVNKGTIHIHNSSERGIHSKDTGSDFYNHGNINIVNGSVGIHVEDFEFRNDTTGVVKIDSIQYKNLTKGLNGNGIVCTDKYLNYGRTHIYNSDSLSVTGAREFEK